MDKWTKGQIGEEWLSKKREPMYKSPGEGKRNGNMFIPWMDADARDTRV